MLARGEVGEVGAAAHFTSLTPACRADLSERDGRRPCYASHLLVPQLVSSFGLGQVFVPMALVGPAQRGWTSESSMRGREAGGA